MCRGDRKEPIFETDRDRKCFGGTLPVDNEDPEYFRVVSDYIHLNPVRAGLLHKDEGLESLFVEQFSGVYIIGQVVLRLADAGAGIWQP